MIPIDSRPTITDTPLDLRVLKKIGADFSSDFDGYDHNMILSPDSYKESNGKEIVLVAKWKILQ